MCVCKLWVNSNQNNRLGLLSFVENEIKDTNNQISL